MPEERKRTPGRHGHESELREFIAERLDRLEERIETIANAVHRVEHAQDQIRAAIHQLQENTMANIDRLTEEVSQNTAVTNSAITLINGLAQQIRDLEPTEAAINALADQLDAQSKALASAVAANTPAEGDGGDEPTEPTEPETV